MEDFGSSNRVTVAIAKVKKTVEERIAAGLLTAEKIEQNRVGLDMAFDEYVKFQELKSAAFAMNKLTGDEAQTIYGYLGNVPDTFNNQPYEVKAILTKIFAELLDAKIKAGRLQHA